jgi:hypothetical protein
VANDYEKILNAIIPTISDMHRDIGSSIVFGVVENVAPLEIRVDGRILLTEEFLVVGNLCKKFLNYVGVSDTEGLPHAHYITELSTLPANGHTHKLGKIITKTASGVGLGHVHSIVGFYTDMSANHSHLVKAPDTKPLETPILADHDHEWELHSHNFPTTPFDTEMGGLTKDDQHTHQVILSTTKLLLTEVELWRELQIGDHVNMVMSSDKQKYYVIERQSRDWGRTVINNVATDRFNV